MATGPLLTAFGQSVEIGSSDVSVSSYPDGTNYTFSSGTGNTGRLLLLPPGSGSTILTGNLTLQRDATLQYDGSVGDTVLGMGGTLTLNGQNLTLLNTGVNTGTGAVANVILGDMNGGGTLTSSGSLLAQNPSTQQAILHLIGTQSNPSSDLTFVFRGGGLSVDNPNSLSLNTTLIGQYSTSLLLPTDGTTIGSNFTYQVDSDLGNWTNVAGVALIGICGSSGTSHAADVVYNGQITYTGTNYIDSVGRAWGNAFLVAGVGSFRFANDTFANTDALAIGGGYNFLAGRADNSVWTTLVVANQANLESLPQNLGFCGGKLDLTSLGATVDLRGYKLCAISIDAGSADPYPGGGSLVVDGTQDVTVRVNAADLLTNNGFLALEQNGSGGSLTVEIDCGGGIVNPQDFAGFQLPAGATLRFVNVASNTVAAGNLQGAGNVDAAGKNLAIGSNLNAGQAFTGTLQNVDLLQKTGTGKTEIGAGATIVAQAAQVSAGNLAVQQGATFTVNTLTVTSGGVLSGNGTIQGDIILANGGWLTPGNSINSHTTDGNLTVQSNGGIEIETVALPTGQTVSHPGTDNDVEHVTGRLTFENGGTLLITEDSTNTGTYKVGDKYYALVAEQGVQNLSGAQVQDNLPGVTIGQYGVEYGTQNVLGSDITGYWLWFDLSRGFSATTPNERRMSDYLVALYDLGQMATLFNTLDGLTSDEQAAALQSLSGESLATSQSLTLDGTMVFTRLLHNRIRPSLRFDGPGTTAASSDTSDAMLLRGQCTPCVLWSGWTAGYGVGGSIHGNRNTTATGAGIGGMLVGIERALGDNATLGFFYNYGHNTGRQSAFHAATTIDDYSFGTYLTDRRDSWYWLTTFGAGYDRYQSRRQVSFASLNETARATFDGWQSQVYGETGWDLTWGCMVLQPYVGLQYLYLRSNSLAEETAAAPTSALLANGADFHALQTHLGTRLARTFCLGGHLSSAEFRAAWVHQLLHDTAPLMNAQFAASAGSGSFSVVGADLARDWCWLGTGLQWRMTDTLTLFTDYDMLLNANQTLHTGSGGLVMTW